MRVCPYCKTEVDLTETNCHFCGRDLSKPEGSPAQEAMDAQAKETKKQNTPWLIIFIVGLCVVLYFVGRGSSSGTRSPSATPIPYATRTPSDFNFCKEASQDYLKALVPILKEWSDADALANSAPRITMATPIANLQAIRREADQLKPSTCAQNAQTYLIKMMNERINMYLAFMADNPDEATTRRTMADAASNVFIKEIDDIKNSKK